MKLLDDLHIVPNDDLMEHVMLRQCWCRPVVKDAWIETVVVHHALDGRKCPSEHVVHEVVQ